MGEKSFDPQNDASFDAYAASYDELHRKNIEASGEGPEYFAEYKCRVVGRMTPPSSRILDFGCGIGNLTRFLVREFADVQGYDPSDRSIERARLAVPEGRFGSDLAALERGEARFDAIVVANVLHHVPPRERSALIERIVKLLAADGQLVVFEHNPYNPLTRRAVATCEFDEDAILLSSRETRGLLRGAGLRDVAREYVVFFPRPFKALRGAEPKLGWLPLGAQYVAHGRR
ncbi:class I SAM-dependent methyltransferase [soil metagenome]